MKRSFALWAAVGLMLWASASAQTDEKTGATLSLTGKVLTQEGKPVARATVSLSRPGRNNLGVTSVLERLQAVTDAAGVYRFRHLLPTDYRVDSVMPPTGSGLEAMPAQWYGHGSVRIFSPGQPTKDFTLKEGCGIRGRVLDEAGKPVGGASVTAARARAAIDGPDYFQKLGSFTATTTTGADGTYLLDGLSPETYQITVTGGETAEIRKREGPALAPSHPLIGIKAERGKTVDVQDVVLTEGGTLSGVVSGGHKPLKDVAVKLGKQQVVTGATGRYRFEGLQTGKVSLEILPPAGSPWSAARVNEVACVAKVNVKRDVALAKGGVVSGVVKDPNGKGVAGATVTAALDNLRYTATTDAEGRYRLVGLAVPQGVDYRGNPKQYGIRVKPPADSDWMQAGRSMTVTPAEAVFHGPGAGHPDVLPGGTTTMDFTLQAGGRIEGKVTDADGKPVADARLQAWRQVGRGGRSYYCGGPMVEGPRTDAEGRFVLRKLPAGPINVTVLPPAGANLRSTDRSSVRVVIGEPATLDAKLQPGGIVSGTVKSPKDAPMAGVDVTVSDTAKARRGWTPSQFGATTDTSGRFRVVGLPAGEYRIALRIFDGTHLCAPETVQVEAGKETDRVLAARVGGRIEVKVVDAKGNPAKDFSARTEPRTPGGQTLHASPDASGTVRFGPLSSGTYVVKLNRYRRGERPLMVASDPIDVTEGETAKSEMTFR